jgi:plasmid stabilization system protein ParE
MARIVFAAIADADSAGIIEDLASKAGRRTALKFSGLFDEVYDRLERYPENGAPRPALGPNIRVSIVAPYIIIYHYAEDADTVTVLRMVDGRRRISGKLLGRV